VNHADLINITNMSSLARICIAIQKLIAITSDDITIKKPTSPTVTLPLTVIDKISEKDAVSVISTKSQRMCKERIVGLMMGICQGCFYQESIETETFGNTNSFYTLSCTVFLKKLL
jgi:hypothetical protein